MSVRQLHRYWTSRPLRLARTAWSAMRAQTRGARTPARSHDESSTGRARHVHLDDDEGLRAAQGPGAAPSARHTRGRHQDGVFIIEKDVQLEGDLDDAQRDEFSRSWAVSGGQDVGSKIRIGEQDLRRTGT